MRIKSYSTGYGLAFLAASTLELAGFVGFVGGENVVRGNLIHGVRGTGSGWGLYTDAETNRERIEGNVVWNCNTPKIDYEYGGPNNNRWINNVLSVAKKEPPVEKALRDLIAAR